MLAHNPRHDRRTQRMPRRRGMAVLMVLLLLSVTLAVSYAMVRSQNLAVEIERNADRRDQARQAAMTGLTLAMKKMQQSTWAGAETTLSGTLSAGQQYSVTYATGDAALTSISPGYKEYPYRMTLTAVGQASDPAASSRVSRCSIQAVMRLVPRAVATEPSNWSSATQNYTIYGNGWGNFSVDVPVHTVGRVRCGLVLDLCPSYNWSSSVRSGYASDLLAMASAGGSDARPFTGPVELPTFFLSGTTKNLLTSMGVSYSNQWPSAITLPSPLASPMQYRLYTGGKIYTATTAAATLQQGVTLQADPLTNPLGLFVRSGDITVQGSVSMQGSLLAIGGGTVRVQGRNVQLAGLDLPALSGGTQSVQLPAVIAENDVRFAQDSGGTISGLVVAGDEFDVAADAQADVSATISGRIIAQNFTVGGRSEWWQTETWWNDRKHDFDEQKNAPNGIRYFPAWLKAAAAPRLDYVPRVTVQPEARSIQYHWKKNSDPIYVPLASDGGLRWELVSWTILP